MIFGLFKKKKTNKDINTDIDTDWLKELYELLGEKNAKSVSDFYNVIFFQLKTNVFTLLAPVNLNDEEKLKFLDEFNEFVMSIQKKYENA